MKKRIPLLRLNYTKSEKQFILEGVQEILGSGFLTMSKKIRHFEELFAKFVKVKYAVAVNSGTSALEIPLRALNVEGKSIIVPTNTFIATYNSAMFAGAKPVLADVSYKDMCLDLENIKKKYNDNTGAVCLVHIGGIISNEIEEIWDGGLL